MSEERMRDDELRRRLHELPGPGGPSARLDVAAAVEGARRRRRPKVAAVSAAVTGAGVLIIAPFVVPGLSPLSPAGTSVLSEQGEQDSGAAPEAAQPTDDDQGASGATESSGPADGSGDAATDPPTDFAVPLDPTVPFCGLAQAGDAGLALRLLQAPSAEGPGSEVARFEVTNVGAGSIGVTLQPVIAYEVVDSIDPAITGGGMVGGDPLLLALEPGESAALDATTALLRAGVCGDGTPSAAVPLAIVSIDGRAPIGVVGEPWDVR